MPKFTSPKELERKFVQDVYNDIAPGFQHARYKAWPYVEQFLKSQPPGSIIADVGCGSGKYLDLITDSFIMGSDTCLKLAELVHDRHHEVAVCNNLQLPYKDKCFDAVISIGVIHHFASAKRRLRALQELGRILRPGGKMLVYVWAMEQQQRKFDAQDVLVPYTGHQRNRAKHRKSSNRSNSKCPEQSIALVLNSPNKIRRSKSCGALYDKYQSNGTPEHLYPGNINTDNHAISSNIEFKVLKEIIQTIKKKKDHLMTNLNARVNNVYPEKEKTFVEGLLMGVVGRFFDKEKRTASSKENKASYPVHEDDSQTRISNVTQFVSGLVKKLFNDKNDSQTPQNIPQEDLIKISERDLKESFYDSLTTWAKEKVNFLALRESKKKVPVYNKTFLFGGELPQGESFDSEYSEVDSDEYQLAACTACFMDSDNKISAEIPERKPVNKNSKEDKILSEPSVRIREILSSSDSDSEGSSSVERLNTDSGISDSEPQERPASAINRQTRAHTTTCYESKNLCSSVNDNDTVEKNQHTLQRYYHVFNQKELPDLIEDGVHGVDVLKEYYDHGNWAVIAEKQ